MPVKSLISSGLPSVMYAVASFGMSPPAGKDRTGPPGTSTLQGLSGKGSPTTGNDQRGMNPSRETGGIR